MSEALSWQDRVTKAARHTPQRPYEDNETSCKNLEREYGFDFDEFLCPVRGNDRNYMIGPLARGWWTIWFPTHAEKGMKTGGQWHPLHEWEDRIAAAVRPESSHSGVPGLSWTINILPFLPDESEVLAGKLSEWFAMSPTPNFGRMFADNWRTHMRGAMSGLAAIVTWRWDGSETFDITPDHAVRTVDAALDILGLGLDAPAAQLKEETPMDEKVAGAAAPKDKGHQDKPTGEIDFGAALRFPQAADDRGQAVWLISPPSDVATQYGIPEDAVTFKVRNDGTGRLKVYEGNKPDLEASKVRTMDDRPVRLPWSCLEISISVAQQKATGARGKR